MGFIQRGFAFGNRRGFRVNPSLGVFILTELISLVTRAGGCRHEVTLTETNPTYTTEVGLGKVTYTLTETILVSAVVS